MAKVKKKWTAEETSLFKQIYHLYSYEELAEIFNCDKDKISNKALTEGLAGKKEYIEVPEGMKRCSTCKEIFELSFFNNNRYNKDGKATQCKACSKLTKSLALRQKKYEEELKEEEAKKAAYLKKFEGVTLICKNHGEQTIDDYRIYKNTSSGNYSRKCKKCEDERIKADREKKIKKQGYV